jgi:hypothetical protein
MLVITGPAAAVVAAALWVNVCAYAAGAMASANA